MRRLAEAFGLDKVRFAFPRADGSVWYPKHFMSPLEENEPYLSAALDNLDRTIESLMDEGFGQTRMVLGGFSQGACLVSEYLARYPRQYAGAVILTGGLIGPIGTRWPVREELAGMPVYYSGSEIDEWIPLARARETIDWLTQSGATVKSQIFRDRPHRVSEEEVGAARAIIDRARR
jgi:predicted esterase